VQSASWTLREQVRFDREQITPATWDSYPILRFTDAPEVTVRVMDAPGEPEVGAGEISVGPVAREGSGCHEDRLLGARGASESFNARSSATDSVSRVPLGHAAFT
jgi:hypothetical protein